MVVVSVELPRDDVESVHKIDCAKFTANVVNVGAVRIDPDDQVIHCSCQSLMTTSRSAHQALILNNER